MEEEEEEKEKTLTSFSEEERKRGFDQLVTGDRFSETFKLFYLLLWLAIGKREELVVLLGIVKGSDSVGPNDNFIPLIILCLQKVKLWVQQKERERDSREILEKVSIGREKESDKMKERRGNSHSLPQKNN